MRKIMLAALAGAFVLSVPALSEDATPKHTVITVARYLDVTTGKYVEHPAIFVGANGRITGIADAPAGQPEHQAARGIAQCKSDVPEQRLVELIQDRKSVV